MASPSSPRGQTGPTAAYVRDRNTTEPCIRYRGENLVQRTGNLGIVMPLPSPFSFQRGIFGVLCGQPGRTQPTQGTGSPPSEETHPTTTHRDHPEASAVGLFGEGKRGDDGHDGDGDAGGGGNGGAVPHAPSSTFPGLNNVYLQPITPGQSHFTTDGEVVSFGKMATAAACERTVAGNATYYSWTCPTPAQPNPRRGGRTATAAPTWPLSRTQTLATPRLPHRAGLRAERGLRGGQMRVPPRLDRRHLRQARPATGPAQGAEWLRPAHSGGRRVLELGRIGDQRAERGRWRRALPRVHRPDGGHCGINLWYPNSECIRATSTEPDGPYTEVIFPSFCHEPVVTAHAGKFLVFHVGSGPGCASPACAHIHNCTAPGFSNGTTDCPETVCPGGQALKAYPDKLGVLESDTLAGGQWSSSFIPEIATQKDTNPAPFVFENGTTILLNRYNDPKMTIRVAVGPTPTGPFEFTGQAVVEVGSEDPHVFCDGDSNFLTSQGILDLGLILTTPREFLGAGPPHQCRMPEWNGSSSGDSLFFGSVLANPMLCPRFTPCTGSLFRDARLLAGRGALGVLVGAGVHRRDRADGRHHRRVEPAREAPRVPESEHRADRHAVHRGRKRRGRVDHWAGLDLDPDPLPG